MKILKYINKNYILILLSVLFGFIITFSAALVAYSKNIQTDIAEEVIRFHVLANSDSEQDQALKIQIRDEVINMLSDELKDSKSKEETRTILKKNISKIKAKAEEIAALNEYDYKIKVEIANSVFPTKNYGDIKLPAGEYEALRILIGEAKGKNWWCVMFPPLCLVDAGAKEIPDEKKEQLKGLLTEEEYNLISKSDEPDIKIKFKIVEILNNL